MKKDSYLKNITMFRKGLILISLLLCLLIFYIIHTKTTDQPESDRVNVAQQESVLEPSQNLVIQHEDFFTQLAQAAMERTSYAITYNPAYFKLDYPGGDVPADKGVCTDVVIRSYRRLGIDLQVKVHEDMKANFDLYPQKWGLKRPDTNIDHRRVPNLMVFFQRHGQVLPISNNPENYQPGDIVTWDLSRGITHIGIVSTQKTSDHTRYLLVHNIGAGPKLEDVLFNWKITGHYRYQS
ncbi:MAG: DUF1287 domain-containing protein [Sedimentisphaerales bacterium]|nr:DUF1287 domain-containing protein [Sedimentisphaerales bacterium]